MLARAGRSESAEMDSLPKGQAAGLSLPLAAEPPADS
jgi:hypothetical protein